jgi:hypothetical protein
MQHWRGKRSVPQLLTRARSNSLPSYHNQYHGAVCAQVLAGLVLSESCSTSSTVDQGADHWHQQLLLLLQRPCHELGP